MKKDKKEEAKKLLEIQNEKLKQNKDNSNIKNYHYSVNTNKLYKPEKEKKYNEDLANQLNHQVEEILKLKPELAEILPEEEPSYIKLYINQLAQLSGLSKPATDFFKQLIINDFVTIKGFVKINRKIKHHIFYDILKYKDESSGGISRIMKALKTPLETLNNTPVLTLVENDKFESDDIEKYYINPMIIGNGNWANIRNRRLRIVLDFQDDDRKITIENLDKIEGFNSKTECKSTDTRFLDNPPELPKEPESNIYEDFDDEVNF